ncbi:MAG TPA: thiamine pyrophosphate-dependent dehydrogenase E1 component subunit alpha [Terriglobales bacterium]|nr:thiamine pyrophosphate-dependent dehydrogenase E1 component subunit alpha [Terriglobales bacterium]
MATQIEVPERLTFPSNCETVSADMRIPEPSLDAALLRRLYSYMLKCRTVEERIRNQFRQGRFSGNYFAAVGQEATEVGVTIDLLPEDTIAPSHRNFITHIMKGTPLNLLFAQIYGRNTSPDRGRSSPAHCGYAALNIITPASTIAAQLNIGTGIALAYKMKRVPNVVVALSGEGSTSLGLWHEAINFAAVHKLPMLVVIENNGWAESVPVALQTAVADISTKALGYGIPGATVDGNDVVAVYRAAQEGILRAREGKGPTLLECKTYRWYGHSEIDPAKYRDPAEVHEWKRRDPIPRMEAYLDQRKLWTDEWKQELLAGFEKEIEEAIAFAEASAFPEAEEALDHVFSFSIRDRELHRKTWEPVLDQRR